MLVNIDELAVFRIIPIPNLEHYLKQGIFCKKECPNTDNFISIGSKEIISQRDKARVKCYPDTVVNDYVPFYFSVRTPMLYNIITGHNVPYYPQENIIYLCFKVKELTANNFNWCYTDGNAAKLITKFYSNLANIDINIDWHSIHTTDFRDSNADGDEDRVRKKHSEFLVRRYVPSSLIKAIVVMNEKKRIEVAKILDLVKMTIQVKVNPNNKFYF